MKSILHIQVKHELIPLVFIKIIAVFLAVQYSSEIQIMTSKKFKTGNIVLKNPTQQFKPSKISPRSPIPFSVSRNSS